jgi:hypothetical protein
MCAIGSDWCRAATAVVPSCLPERSVTVRASLAAPVGVGRLSADPLAGLRPIAVIRKPVGKRVMSTLYGHSGLRQRAAGSAPQPTFTGGATIGSVGWTAAIPDSMSPLARLRKSGS